MTRPLLLVSRGSWLVGLCLAAGLLSTGRAGAQTIKTLPGDYATFTAAINDINITFPAGGVTVNVAAGYAETSAAALPLLTAQGAGGATGQIVFQKSGAGTNPKITAAAGTTTTLDGIVRLSGADYVTFDGIDLSEAATNTTVTTQMEFGYALFRPTTTNGCQNNTIKNCVVTLNKTNTATVGIYGAVGTAAVTTSVAATSPAGANSGNKIFGCVITNAVQGIYLTGNASTTAANFDLNNEIGVGGANTVGNFGGLAVSGWGIGVNVQNGAKIANNIINSTLNYTSATASTAVLASTVTSTLRGIYGNTAASSNIDITNNTITLASGATTNSLIGIDNGIGSTAAGNTVNITGNTVTNCTYGTATTGTFTGINNSATAATVNMSNNTVTNNSATGTGTMTLITSGTATTLNLNNNVISNNSKQAAAATLSISLFALAVGTAAITATGNTITNNTVVTSGVSTGAGFVLGYYQNSSPTSETLTSNTITGLSVSGTSTNTSSLVSGIRTFPLTTTVQLIAQNTIGSISIATGSGTVTGLNLISGGGTGSGISRNKIYDLSATGALGIVNGITIAGGTTFPITNNLIGDLRAPSATGLLAIAGLNILGSTQVNAYFNTIYLSASSTGATFGTSGVYLGSTTPILDLRDNIIVNTSTAAGTGGYTAALRRVSGTAATVPANYAATSNNNLFWAGAPTATNLIYVEGTTTATNPQQTLAAYKAFMANRDQSSVNENAPFLSTTGSAATFLHINTSTATQIESGGAAIAGITNDYDGDTRNVNTPDLGADEGTFTPSDLSPPSITYTALGNTSSTVNRTLTATITDASGVATGAGAPRIYYRKGTTGVYFSALATSVAGSVYTFSLDYANVGGTPVASDVFQYYVAAQDASINNNAGTSPSGGSGINPPGSTAPGTPNQYIILPTLAAGNYYVGTSAHTPPATYATLTAAAAAYNSSGLGGAVNFILIDPSYTTGETYPITFNANADASAANRLTISPEAGVNATVSGSNTTALLVLNGADYVTLDGSNNATTSRNLTLANAGAASTTVLLSGAGTGGGATNDVLRNLNITALASTSGVGISVGGATGGTTGADNDNVTIQNNSIQQAFLGIYVGGTAAASAGGADGLSIVGNVVGPVATGTGNIGGTGMFMANAVAPSISGNTVQNVGLATAGGLTVGMNFSTGVSNATVTGNTISGVTVTAGSFDALGLNLGTGFTGGIVDRNKVLNIVSNTSTYGGRGIDISTGSATSNLRISNNFVAGINGSGWSSFATDAIVGIRLLGTTGGVSLHYNSVSLSGSYSAASAGVYQSAALYVASTVTALDVRDNVFANTLVNGTSASKAYAFCSSAPKTAFTAINYNDYFVGTGSQAFLGNLGGSGTSVGTTGDLATLAAFQATTGTGQDANSLGVDPTFTSATDLHTAASALNAVATPIAGITTDLDGDVRNASTPDVGADEFTPPTLDLKPTALTAPATGQTCFTSAEPVTVTIQNNAGGPVDFALNPATVTVNVTGAGTATLTATLTSGTLAAGATQNVTLTPTLNMAAFGTYTFAISATVTGDQNLANDNLTPVPTITTVAPVAGVLSPASASICQSGTATLALAGAANGSIQYQSSPDNVTFTDIAGATAAAYTTPVLTSTTYYRAQTRCGTNNATSNVATITVNNPLITGTNTPVVVCTGSAATLTATGSTGSTVRFFAAAAGGTALATGTAGTATASYTTPTLTAAATYYAEAFIANGSTTSISPLTNAFGTGAASTASQYLLFNVTQPATLTGVYVYPGAAGNVVIEYRSTTGTVLQSATVAVTAAQVNTKTFIPVNFNLVAGTAQRLGIGTGSVSLFRNDAGASYPYTGGGGVSITGNSFDPAYYYYFYNWQISSDCASGRTAVQVNVNPAATANAGTAPAGVCAGSTYSTTGSYGGSATSATYTSSGTGAFSNGGLIDGTTPSVTYTPSAADITAGSVTLTLTTAGPCAAVTSTLPLTISSTATYTGAAPGDGSNWFNAANWTACVPSRTVDAVIPAGLTNYPALTAAATAEVRTLTLANGARLAQSAGILNVYGNLSNGGTADLTGGKVTLLGTSPTVTGLSTFYALEVNLAGGTVQLSNSTSIVNQLKMTQGVLNTNSYTLTLLTGSTLVEDDNSYLLGTVSVPDRTLTAGTTESFSGIGLVLTPAVGSTSPGATPVVRTTGTALTGVGTSVSIKRYFDIQPVVNAGLNVAMDFSYLDHELNGIAAVNLALFKSVVGTSGPWANQQPITIAGNTVSKTGIADFSIWTLGSSANPLPVELTAFTAERQGSNAALAWATATEKNSRGFEVQVSIDGRSFRTLEFIASATANSTAPRHYAYLDQEASKAGLRYYRLRQVDLSGAATFSPVRTVRFDAAFALHLTAAPNPFEGHLTLTVELPAGPATAPASLSLTDAVGRTLRAQPTPALPAGQSQLELPGLAGLASGVYFVHLAVPGQPTQHLKVVKE